MTTYDWVSRAKLSCELNTRHQQQMRKQTRRTCDCTLVNCIFIGESRWHTFVILSMMAFPTSATSSCICLSSDVIQLLMVAQFRKSLCHLCVTLWWCNIEYGSTRCVIQNLHLEARSIFGKIEENNPNSDGKKIDFLKILLLFLSFQAIEVHMRNLPQNVVDWLHFGGNAEISFTRDYLGAKNE